MYRCDSKQVLGLVFCIFVVVASEDKIHSVRKRSATCVLPPYPDRGHYEVAGDPAAKPGDVFEFAYLNVSCYPGSEVIGNNVMLCVQGEWSRSMPQCEIFCPLRIHESVTYTCKRPGSNSFEECKDYEPVGTKGQPTCRKGYYTASALPLMECHGGTWNFIATCIPECGIIPANMNTLPWYTYIYQNYSQRWNGLCGGSIISKNVVVSAAHCFEERYFEDLMVYVQPSSPYIELKINKKPTTYISKHHVRQIHVCRGYMGELSNFQNDIALLELRTPVVYSAAVMPVCLNFDSDFDKRQMQAGRVGTVAVWSSPVNEQSVISIHKYQYIPMKTCADIAPPYFKEYVTNDKFCTGVQNSTMITRGNSGSGISFPDDERGITRHYLRGVVSTASADQNPIRFWPTGYVTFTKIISYENFIKEHLTLF